MDKITFHDVKVRQQLYQIHESGVSPYYIKSILSDSFTGDVPVLKIQMHGYYATIEVPANVEEHEDWCTTQERAEELRLEKVVDIFNEMITTGYDTIQKAIDYMKQRSKFSSNSTFKPNELKELAKALNKLKMRGGTRHPKV